jgi:hypothetical protein
VGTNRTSTGARVIADRLIAGRLAVAERVVRLGLRLAPLPGTHTHPLFGRAVNFRCRVREALRTYRVYLAQDAEMKKWREEGE